MRPQPTRCAFPSLFCWALLQGLPFRDQTFDFFQEENFEEDPEADVEDSEEEEAEVGFRFLGGEKVKHAGRIEWVYHNQTAKFEVLCQTFSQNMSKWSQAIFKRFIY